MLIEQIIAFQMRGPGPSGRICTSTFGYFQDKTKIFDWIIIYCQNIAEANVPYFPLPGPNHSPTLTTKCQILNVFWT